MELLCILLAGLAGLLAPAARRSPQATSRPALLAQQPPRPSAHSVPRSPGTDRLVLLRAAAVTGVGLAAWMVVPGRPGVVIGVALAGLAWWRSRSWEGALQRQRRAALEAELPSVVDLMVAVLRAGLGPAQGLERVAAVVSQPMREELRVPLARLRLGTDPVSVWAAMGAHPQLHRLGTALARATESGAPVAEALLRLSADLRERRRADVEARVRQVEVKAAVPLGVCLLPAFVLLGVVPLVAGSAMHLLGR